MIISQFITAYLSIAVERYAQRKLDFSAYSLSYPQGLLAKAGNHKHIFNKRKFDVRAISKNQAIDNGIMSNNIIKRIVRLSIRLGSKI